MTFLRLYIFLYTTKIGILFLYLAPRTDFPHDLPVLAVVIDGAGLDFQWFFSGVAAVRHWVGVRPTVVVDPMARHGTVFHPFSATMRALQE